MSIAIQDPEQIITYGIEPAVETTPETDAAAELVAVATEIGTYQDSLRPRPGNGAMIRRFPALGSDKTYAAFLRGLTEGYRAEEWLVKYRGVLCLIEEEATVRANEELYPDLRPAEETALAVAQLIRQRGKRRLVVIQGGSGAGKTSALSLIAAKYPGTCHRVDANEGWKSPLAAYRAIARALGAKSRDGGNPVSAGDWLELIVAHVGQARPILLLDEGHHMTGQTLNGIKSMINETGLRVVIAAIGTLWDKLQRAANQEAMQLVRNRMHCRVILREPAAADVRRLIERRCHGYKASAARVQSLIAESKAYGLYNYVARVADEAADLAAEHDAAAPEVDDALLIAAASNVRRDIDGRD